MDVVVTGMKELLAGLGRAANRAQPEVKKVVTKGALNIKNDWRKRWSGHPVIKRLPYAISYDVRDEIGGTSAEIGPDKKRIQGPLANIIEFGSPTSAPMPGGLPALEDEAPKFQAALQKLGIELLEP